MIQRAKIFRIKARPGHMIVACMMVLVSASFVFAALSDAHNVSEAYPGVTVACTACHVESDFKKLNAYGTAYHRAGRNANAVRVIDDADSDADGRRNADEIKSGTNPGDAAH